MAGYGFRGHIGIAQETVWGTAVGASDYVEALSESIVTDIERFDVRNVFAGMYEPDDETGIVRHSGDLVVPAHPVSIGYFLDGALGIASGTEVLSGFLHTTEFTALTADWGSLNAVPGYTLEIFRDVTSSMQYKGCQFNTLELSVAPNQELRATINVIAQTRAGITATSPSFPGSPAGVFKFDTASLSLGGSAIARCENFTFSIDNQLEGVPVLNASTDVARIQRTGPQLIRLGGTMAFDDITDFNSFVNQTEQALVITFTKANSFSMSLDFPRTVFTSFPQQITGRDRLTVDFDMKALYHTGSSSAMKASLTTVSSFS